MIWPLSQEQRELALEDVQKAAVAYQEQGGLRQIQTVVTDVETTQQFTPAESIHQHFWTKSRLKATLLAVATLAGQFSNALDPTIAKSLFLVVFIWTVWKVCHCVASYFLALSKATHNFLSNDM